MTSKPRVLITPEALREAHGPETEVLTAAGFEYAYPQNPHFARGRGGVAESQAELAGFSAVIASSELYNAEVVAAAPSLRVVARCGVGYDQVDVPALTEHDIALTITPNANHEAVAELTIGLLMAVTKFTILNDQSVRQGEWPRRLPRPLRGSTFGLLGLGRIGRSTARRAKAFGMRLIAHDKFASPEFAAQHDIELVKFDQLLSEADFLSIHCPHTHETEGLFCTATFDKMKPGAILINTARGKIVVEADLADAIRRGQIGGAGLDVFEVEPPSKDSPLMELDRVVLSPHVGGTDQMSMIAMGVEAAECIVQLQQGGWPEGAVINDGLRQSWTW